MSEASRSAVPVPPGGIVGILGGGQLGRMLAMAAARLGLKAHIYCDTADGPAADVSAAYTHGAYDDHDALARFASDCDAVTFEFENVPGATAEILASAVSVFPPPRALAVAQDRFEEKSFVRSLDLGTPPFARIDSAGDVSAAIATTGLPAILKTRRMGYDGKGQAKIASEGDALTAVKKFAGSLLILEGFVDFECEVSALVARGRDGSFAAYDVPENRHENGILRRSTVPSRLSPARRDEAVAIARRIAEALDYVGVLAVELFACRDGTLLVNEMAPRVHNSGHWTIDACLVSQFEQHIRAVAGWPLGNPARHSDAVMENLIGAEANDWRALAGNGGALHLYGKSEARPGRKMGHVTWLKEK